MRFCLCWQNTFTYKDFPRKKAIFGWIVVEKTIAGAQEKRAINTVEPKTHHHEISSCWRVQQRVKAISE